MLLTVFEWFWSRPSWHWSYFWAALSLLLPSLLAVLARAFSSKRPRPFVDVIAGLDGRWSTSKAGVVLWTAAIWFAFVAILFHTHGDGLRHSVLMSEYFVVLGIPAAAAVAAKGITTSKISAGEIAKPQDQPTSNPIAGIAQIVTDDNDRTDLLDSQYFGFNLILLGFFLFQFFGHPQFGFPNLPDTLLALTGVSAAAYVGKKGVSGDAPPTIRSIFPPKAAPGATVKVFGINLATANERDVGILIHKLPATTKPAVLKDDVTEVETVVPSTAPAGSTDLVAIAYDGRESEAKTFEVGKP